VLLEVFMRIAAVGVEAVGGGGFAAGGELE
jgi:hypothetical protein